MIATVLVVAAPIAVPLVASGAPTPATVAQIPTTAATPNAPTSPAANGSTAIVGIPGAQAASAQVNEAPAPTLASAARVFDGWPALWDDLRTSNLDLRVALAEIERAEAATRIAWAGALPTATGTVSLTHIGSATPGTFLPGGNYLQAQLQVVAPLINLRAFHAIETSRELEAITQLSILDVRRKIALNLAHAAVAISSAQRLAELNRIGLEAARDRLVLTRKRLLAGVGDVRDLVRAQQDVATARSVIASADEALVQAREALAEVLGHPGDIGIAGEPGQIEAQVAAFCGDASAAHGERIDIVIAKKQIEIAQRNVDDIALKFVPTLTASFTASESGAAFGGPFVPGWSISGVLTIPLYDGGVRYGEMRDRKALVEEAKARALQIEIGAVVERSQARRAIDVAVAAAVSAREARDLAAEADRLARVAYANGVGTNFDLIDAGRILRQAETTLVLRDLDVARARIALPFIEGRCAGVK